MMRSSDGGFDHTRDDDDARDAGAAISGAKGGIKPAFLARRLEMSKSTIIELTNQLHHVLGISNIEKRNLESAFVWFETTLQASCLAALTFIKHTATAVTSI